MPKLRIEESAARRQAMIDRGEEVIVGVNKYRKAQGRPDRHPRHRQRTKVRAAQIARLEKIRAERDEAACTAALAELNAARRRAATCWTAAVEAARARATVGEISDGDGKGVRPPPAEVKTLAGVYGAAYEGDEGFAAIQKDVEAFAEAEGRRPRMLVVKMGQDGHDRGAKVIATAFADIGFDVDVGPLFQTPEEAAQDAIDNDVHVVGISSQAAGHKTLAPKLIEALKAPRAGRHHRDLRRRDPAAGLRVPEQGRREGDLRAGHQHPRGGAVTEVRALPASLMQIAWKSTVGFGIRSRQHTMCLTKSPMSSQSSPDTSFSRRKQTF
jgi:methylmalonyl-CoA mutase